MVSYQPQSLETSTTSSGGLRTSLDQGRSLPLVEEVHLPFQDLRTSPPQVSHLIGLAPLHHLTSLKTPSPSPSRRFHPYSQRAIPQNPQQWLRMRLKLVMQEEFKRGMMGQEEIIGAFHQVVNWVHDATHHDILGCYECRPDWLHYYPNTIYNLDHMLHRCPLGVDCCSGYGY